MADLPLEKVTISGPTLSSIINRFTSSPGNIEGLLFGRHSLLASSLSDDSPSPSPSSLVAAITGFISGDVATLLRSLSNLSYRHQLIGWFSGRRKSPVRPSLREYTLSHSLSSSGHPPSVFLLLTTPFPDSQTLIHTHDYRVYHYRASLSSFDALQLDVVNIGPAFRGQYTAFCPNSELPYLPCDFRSGSPMREDEKDKASLSEMKKVSKDQKDLDSYAEGYELGNLSRLMGSDAVNYMGGVEELYEKMLAKLESLAKKVEISSAKVLEQENCNMKLRRRVAGLE